MSYPPEPKCSVRGCNDDPEPMPTVLHMVAPTPSTSASYRPIVMDVDVLACPFHGSQIRKARLS